MLPSLRLSLQFARSVGGKAGQHGAASHRATLTRHFVSRCIRHALSADGEITVRIVDMDEGRRLNREFRASDHATNVLTFDYAQEPTVMADLVLCASVVAAEARTQRKRLADHYAHLLVHGTLHAQGWDHAISQAEAERMEAREVELLAALGFANPYA